MKHGHGEVEWLKIFVFSPFDSLFAQKIEKTPNSLILLFSSFTKNAKNHKKWLKKTS